MTANIDHVWKSLQDEDGVSFTTRGALVRCTKTRHTTIPNSRRKAKQKLSVIKELHISTKLDLDALTETSINQVYPSTTYEFGSDSAINFLSAIANEDDSIHAPVPSTCDNLDDSDDEDTYVADRYVSVRHDPGNYGTIKRLVAHLGSDDVSSRVFALTKLRNVIFSLVHQCPLLPQLDFPPPFHESNIKRDRVLPLVSDLATPAHYECSNGLDDLLQNSPRPGMKDAGERDSENSNELQTIVDLCGRKLFRLVGDKVEKCRRISLECLDLLLLANLDVAKHIPYLIPVLVARYSTCTYDKDLEVFVQDNNLHEFYKRGGAVDRQDRDGLLSQSASCRLIEPNEDLRLALCKTLQSVVRGLVSRHLALLDAYYSDIILALQTSLRDPFPDVRVATCLLLTQCLRIPEWNKGAKFFSIGLARSAIPNCRHRKTAVVIASMDLFEASVCVPDRAKLKGAGSSAIVDLVGYRGENVLPVASFYDSSCAVSVNTLAELASHKNHRVRLRCCEMLSNFLIFLPDRCDHQQRLLPYVLSFINDILPEVQWKALECIEKCGSRYENEHPDDVLERLQLGVDGDNSIAYDYGLPSPFSRRPSLGARLFVRSNASRFYLALLSELSNWKEQTRKRSVDLLMILVVYCEEHLTKDFQRVVSSLAKAIEVETQAEMGDREILEKICQVVCLVSKYVDPAAFFPLVSPRIAGDSSSGTSNSEDGSHSETSRCSYVTILSSLIQGSPLHRLLPYWQKMASLLANENCIGTFAGTKVKLESLKAFSVLIERVMSKHGRNGLITYLNETGKMSEARAALLLCQDSLLQNEDQVATECAHEISQIISSMNQN
ncbi:hypothetical protein HJC23_014042 [Cyclotella cryptica]|uniref:Uncharacterized protein n=1 Tax=Cyclotella cryptica TaxID=29204 RepID=A0ABD3QTD4_9STRA|eukprot:CCRYP_002429-RA/>CCRYP_002429-RA protein AED:0.36 eAED:0.36 QI:0/1/0/1/1/1/2/0/835